MKQLFEQMAQEGTHAPTLVTREIEINGSLAMKSRKTKAPEIKTPASRSLFLGANLRISGRGMEGSEQGSAGLITTMGVLWGRARVRNLSRPSPIHDSRG